MFASGFIWPHLWTTLQEIGLGFALGTFIGIGLAVVLTQVPVLMRIANPYIVASQAAPKLALAPIFAVWFGFGMTPEDRHRRPDRVLPPAGERSAGLRVYGRGYDELFR